MAAKEWVRRHRKRQGGITECRRTFAMPPRIDPVAEVPDM